MNVVPATSSASAPSASVLPGHASGAALGVGPTFADVLQQLAGGETPSPGVGQGTSRATGAAVAIGQSNDKDEAGDEVAGASTDLTVAMGVVTVPVALVIPVVAELPPAVVAGDTAAADEPRSNTSRSLLPTAAAAPGAAARAGSSTVTAGASAGHAARSGQSADGAGVDPAFGVAAATVIEPTETSLRSDDAPVGHPLDGSVASERASGRGARDLRDLTWAPGAARRNWSESARNADQASGDHAMSPAATAVASAVSFAVPVSAPVATPAAASTHAAATSELPGTSALGIPQTAARLAGLVTGPGRDFEGARGLTPSLARVIAGPPAGASAPAALTEIAAAVTATTVTAAAAATAAQAVSVAAVSAQVTGAGVPADLEALIADVTARAASATLGTTATATTATRGHHHPGLSAALRAFQQAGAPPVAEHQHQGPSVTDTASETVTPARFTSFVGAETDAASVAADAGRRLSSPPALATLIAPSLGGDLRIGAGPGPSARLDGASVATLTPADGEDVAAQIVHSIRVQWSGGAGEARVRLRPEHLGEVVATIKVEQGAVTATLQAERSDVRRWMEANTQTLREGLVEHGLKLDRLVVLSEPARGESRDDSQGRPRGRHPQQPPPRPRRPRVDDDGATFELNT